MNMLVLAHAGPGSTWQAFVVVAGIVLAVAAVGAAVGRWSCARPSDLVVPVAAATAAGAIGVLGHAWISDVIGWGLPLAVVAAATLLLAVFTPLELRGPTPLALGAAALAAVAGIGLYQPLTIALHPPPDLLPLAGNATVRIVEPTDGALIRPGTLTIEVAVDGAGIGPPFTPLDEVGDDPTRAASLGIYVDGDRVPVEWDGCSVADPCSTLQLQVKLNEPGPRRLAVELTRGDGTPFAPLVIDRVTVEVAD